MTESRMLQRLNSECGDMERKARRLMEIRFTRALSGVQAGGDVNAAANELALAVADYVIIGQCGLRWPDLVEEAQRGWA